MSIVIPEFKKITEAQERFLMTEVIPFYLIYSKKDGDAYCQRCDSTFNVELLGKTKPGMETICPICNQKVRLKAKVHKDYWISERGTGIIPCNIDGEFALRYFNVDKNYAHGSDVVNKAKIKEITIREIAREIYHDNGSFTTYDRGWRDKDFKWCKNLRNGEYWYSNYTHKIIGMHVGICNENVHLYTRNINSFIKNTPVNRIDFKLLFTDYHFCNWYDIHSVVEGMYEEQYCLFFEYLIKSGFKTLAIDYVHNSWRTININEKSLIKMLGLTKEKYNKLLTMKSFAKVDDVIRMQKEIKYNLKTEEDWEVYSKYIDNSYRKESFFELFKFTMHKLNNYIKSQGNVIDLSYYVDYLNMCNELGLDMKNSFVVFPNDLNQAHDMVGDMYNDMKFDIKLRKAADEANESANDYMKTIEENTKYQFEDDKFEVVVPKSTYEIGEEGFKLRHCVASYVEDIIKGSKTILFLRQKNEPAIPFFTMEIIGNEITQCKGYRNSPRPEDVEKFLQLFALKMKLSICQNEHFAAMI